MAGNRNFGVRVPALGWLQLAAKALDRNLHQRAPLLAEGDAGGHGMTHAEPRSCAPLRDRGSEVALVRGDDAGDVVAAAVAVPATDRNAYPLGIGRDHG